MYSILKIINTDSDYYLTKTKKKWAAIEQEVKMGHEIPAIITPALDKTQTQWMIVVCV